MIYPFKEDVEWMKFMWSSFLLRLFFFQSFRNRVHHDLISENEMEFVTFDELFNFRLFCIRQIQVRVVFIFCEEGDQRSSYHGRTGKGPAQIWFTLMYVWFRVNIYQPYLAHEYSGISENSKKSFWLDQLF